MPLQTLKRAKNQRESILLGRATGADSPLFSAGIDKAKKSLRKGGFFYIEVVVRDCVTWP